MIKEGTQPQIKGREIGLPGLNSGTIYIHQIEILVFTYTLEYQINVGYQIEVALGILVKINESRVSNKRSLENFYENQ